MTGTAALPGADVDAPTSSAAIVERCLDRITQRDDQIRAWALDRKSVV